MTDPVSVSVAVGFVALLLTAVAFGGLLARRWALADQRADRLVRELLTPDELCQLQRDGYLAVRSRLTPGRIYRIPARPGLVTVIDADKPVETLCLQPARAVHDREHVLVHKLLLEGEELEYWQQANHLARPSWRDADGSRGAIWTHDLQVAVWTGCPPGVLSQR